MKKFLFIAAITAAFSMVMASEMNSQTKVQMKEARKQAKEMTKQGWTTDGTHSIEYCFLQYYSLEAENETVEGHATGFSNKKLAARYAMKDALTNYVIRNTAYIEGAGAELTGKLNGQELDNMVDGAISTFGASVDGKISQSFMLYKEENGMYDCTFYGYINKNTAEELRKEAIENATDDADMAKDFLNAVSEFVNESK